MTYPILCLARWRMTYPSRGIRDTNTAAYCPSFFLLTHMSEVFAESSQSLQSMCQDKGRTASHLWYGVQTSEQATDYCPAETGVCKHWKEILN